MWDYPRPPRLERVASHLRVMFGGAVIADTKAGFRVLETSHPPVYYFPRRDIAADALTPAAGSSFCEWKGLATYFDVGAGGVRAHRAAWCYPEPSAPFAAIAGHVAFYPGPMEAGATLNAPPPSPPCVTMSPSMPARWTPVSSMTRR